MYKRFGKRILDIMIVLPLLVIISPILGLIALWVKFDSSGPIFFTQPRLGKDKKDFKVYKFRTMTDRPRSVDREIMKGDPEVTGIGYWLRRFKLDELPQLWNVITGDMSIVGPRPAMPTQLEEYDEIGLKRLEVQPGLTGLAQVNGNIYLPWPERWKFDAEYVDHLSFKLDLKILWKTVAVIALGEERFVNAAGRIRGYHE